MSLSFSTILWGVDAQTTWLIYQCTRTLESSKCERCYAGGRLCILSHSSKRRLQVRVSSPYHAHRTWSYREERSVRRLFDCQLQMLRRKVLISCLNYLLRNAQPQSKSSDETVTQVDEATTAAQGDMVSGHDVHVHIDLVQSDVDAGKQEVHAGLQSDSNVCDGKHGETEVC